MATLHNVLYIVAILVSVQGKSLVLNGGGDVSPAVYDRIIELAGGAGIARIGIVTASSADPLDSAIWYQDLLLAHGALETYWIPVYEGNEIENSNPIVVGNIRRMTGFMFGGGDQARVVRTFYNSGRVESPALAAIREVYNDGAVIAGTSAGTAVQPSPAMMMGGMSYEALRYGAYPDGTQIGVDDLVYDPAGGIAMLDGYVTDSHFSERGREGRLIRLLADTRGQNGADYGFGVDQDTALVITNVGTVLAEGQVMGPYGVFIADMTRSNVLTTSPNWSIEKVYGNYLHEGDRFNLYSHTVTIDMSWKENLAGNEYYDNAVTSNNIFDGSRSNPNEAPQFVSVARSVFDSRLDTTTWGRTHEANPRFYVDFTQDAFSSGYGGYHPVSNKWRISYVDLRIDITYT